MTRPFSPAWVVIGLMVGHVVMKIAALPTVLQTPLQGDEGAYHRAAAAIARAIRSVASGGGLPIEDLQTHVVGHGWFMPGSPLLLAPLHLVNPDPSVASERLWIGALTLVGFLAAVSAIWRVAGWKYAAALLVVPGLVPLWVSFSYTAWGDLPAGIAVVALLALLVHLWGRLETDQPVRIRHGLLLGLLLVATLYLRSNVLPLVAAVLLLCLAAIMCHAKTPAFRRGLTAWVVSLATFAALLLPWSYAVSRTFDHRVVTTTTVPISMAYAFGDRDDLCLGPCPPGNVWFAMAGFAWTVSQETGENQLDVQQRMADRALAEVTPQSYASSVLDNFDRYVLQPTGYEQIFRTRSDEKTPPTFTTGEPTTVSRISATVSQYLYFGCLALGAAGILIVRRVSRRAQVVGVLSGLFAATLMSQPFVHIGSPRYWPIFIPMFALASAGLFVRSDPQNSSVWLRRLQLLIAFGWILVLGGLALVAAWPE